jgi:hypothetical protein
MNDFLSNNCDFTSLDEKIREGCSFDCGNKDLNDFFLNNAILYSAELLGKTYCFILHTDPSIIVGEFTVSNDSIRVEDLPNARKKKINKEIPRPKQMKHYPAVLIGRFGVNVKYKKQHIGTEMMNFIKSWFLPSMNKTGCRYIVVDAYNESAPLQFYQRNDFEYLFSTEEQEAQATDIEVNQLKTRFMYFDLIKMSE